MPLGSRRPRGSLGRVRAEGGKGSISMSRFKLWRLRRERKRSGKSYSEYVDKAESADDAQFRICEAMDVRDDIRDKILQLRSLQLQDQAEDLGIPIPAF